MLGQLAKQLRLVADQIGAHIDTMEQHDMDKVDVLLWLTTLEASHNLSRFSGKISQAIVTQAGPITPEVKKAMDSVKSKRSRRSNKK